MVAFISVNYEELKPETYAGFTLKMGDRVETINTGNPTVDYVAIGCIAYTIAGGRLPIMQSSSIDHFIMDGGDLLTEDIPEELANRGREAAKSHLNLPSIPEA